MFVFRLPRQGSLNLFGEIRLVRVGEEALGENGAVPKANETPGDRKSEALTDDFG
jgi:hypothetical protein